MKITICAFDAPGNIDGPTTWLKNLVPFLKEKGNDITFLFYANKYKIRQLDAYSYFKKLGYNCKLIHLGLYADEVAFTILEELKKDTPDIFLSNYFPFSLVLTRWCNEWNIPTIMVIHNDDAHHYEIVSAFAKNEDPKENVSVIVAVSKSILNQLVKLKTKPELVHIPYGVFIPPFQKSKLTPKDNFRLLFVGRLNDHQKKITEVVKAFCLAAKEVQGTSFTICGGGTNKMIEKIKSVIAASGQDEMVKYIGTVPNREINALMQKHHCIVLLSEYEGLGIVVLEGMANGLVPICFDMKSGISEELTNGHNGILVNNRHSAFVGAVKKLKTDPDTFSLLSENAYQTAVDNYSIEHSNKLWLHLLNKLKQAQLSVIPGHLPERSLINNLIDKHINVFRIYNPRPHNLLKAFFKKIYYNVKHAV